MTTNILIALLIGVGARLTLPIAKRFFSPISKPEITEDDSLTTTLNEITETFELQDSNLWLKPEELAKDSSWDQLAKELFGIELAQKENPVVEKLANIELVQEKPLEVPLIITPTPVAEVINDDDDEEDDYDDYYEEDDDYYDDEDDDDYDYDDDDDDYDDEDDYDDY